MSKNVIDSFNESAASWDDNPRRVAVARAVAEAIIQYVPLQPQFDGIDFGCGTGLVSFVLHKHLRKITALDTSPGMLKELEGKLSRSGVNNIHTKLIAEDGDPLPVEPAHLIFSSMTLHHIQDIGPLVRRFHEKLLPGGWLAVADLFSEEGDFHDDASVVAHKGFDPESLADRLRAAGFANISCRTAHTIEKEVAGKGMKQFPIFLLQAQKAEQK